MKRVKDKNDTDADRSDDDDNNTMAFMVTTTLPMIYATVYMKTAYVGFIDRFKFGKCF